jgi:5-methylcytosine-specific restriction endonuclease McrA
MGLRKQAKEAGLKTYFTGKPCSNGHVSDRFVTSGSCRLCAADGCARWEAKNKDSRAAYYRYYREKNPELLRERGAVYRARNAEKVAATQRTWNQANKEKRRVYARETAHKRRAYKADTRSDLTRDQIEEIIKIQKGKCALCLKKTTLTLDHITPLSRGGENTRRNIQMLCKPCNLSKGAKLPEVFSRTRGMLL